MRGSVSNLLLPPVIRRCIESTLEKAWKSAGFLSSPPETTAKALRLRYAARGSAVQTVTKALESEASLGRELPRHTQPAIGDLYRWEHTRGLLGPRSVSIIDNA